MSAYNGLVDPRGFFKTYSNGTALPPGQNKSTDTNAQRPGANPPKTSGLNNNPGISAPAIENTELDDMTTRQANTHLGEQRNARDEGLSDTEDIFNKVKQTPDTDLNKWNRSNIAQDGGQFGNLNGMQFDDTLRLSREADAYNNRPTEQVRDWRPGGSTNIGSVSYVEPYNRPKIETEEMREMQKARQLDLNQKQMAQQLQAAVNAKDYDAFKQMYQQMFGIELNKYQLDSAMRDFERRSLITNQIMNARDYFTNELKLYFGLKTAQYCYELSRENPILAMYFCNIIAGYPAADLEQVAKYSYLYAGNVYNRDGSLNYSELVKREQQWKRMHDELSKGIEQESDNTSKKKNTPIFR